MAVTVLPQPIAPNIPPASRIRMFALTFTGSYTAPGEVLTVANLGMSLFYSVQLTGSPIPYMPIMVPTTPATQDGSFTTFSLGWIDLSPAGACVQLPNGAYPAPILAGYVYAYVHGR